MAIVHGPNVDHAGSATSHFMFVKRRKDETAKEGDLQLTRIRILGMQLSKDF